MSNLSTTLDIFQDTESVSKHIHYIDQIQIAMLAFVYVVNPNLKKRLKVRNVFKINLGFQNPWQIQLTIAIKKTKKEKHKQKPKETEKPSKQTKFPNNNKTTTPPPTPLQKTHQKMPKPKSYFLHWKMHIEFILCFPVATAL